MKRRRGRQHGAITVFLSFVMVAIIAFMGMLVDMARMRVAEPQVKRASQLALDSVMSRYSRRLREDYGLFGYAGGEVNDFYMAYLDANLHPAQERESGEFMQLLRAIVPGEEIHYGDMLNLSADGEGSSGTGENPLSSPDVLYRQIIEFSKFRIPIHMVLNNTLDSITDLQEGMADASEDSAAYDRMGDLSVPMEDYAGERSELSAAVQTLDDEVALMNAAAQAWNRLVDGGQTGERVDASYGANVSLPELEIERGSVNGHSYIAGAHWTSERTRYYSHSVSAIPYDMDSVAAAFAELEDDIVADIYAIVAGEFSLRFGEEQDYLDEELERYGELSEDDAQLLDFLVQQHNAVGEQAEDWIREAMRIAEGIAADFCPKLRDAFERSLTTLTAQYLSDYNEHRSAVLRQIGAVRQAIADVERQGGKVDDTMAEIDDDLRARVESERISPDLFTVEWSRKDRANTQELREQDDYALAELKDAVDDIEAQLEQPPRFTADEVAGAFMDGVDGGSSWDASRYHIEDEVGFDGSFEIADGSAEQTYKDEKAKAEETRSKAEAESKALGSLNPEERYNPEPIPDEYQARFVAASDVEDEDDVPKVGDDTKADEADRASEQMQGGFSGLTGMFSDGIQYVLGAVYCSEYILNMFSNAAPAQADDSLPAVGEPITYARVHTLRNAIPVGLQEYKAPPEDIAQSKLRLGYFYNAEVEYVLFGSPKEIVNVQRAQVLLRLLFTVTNYLQVRQSYTLQIPVEAAAIAGTYLCIPPTLTKFILYMGFALVETEFEMFYIMRGYGIPVFSTQEDKLFMLNSPQMVLAEGRDFKLTYEFYLRLRLIAALILDRDEVMLRLANLIQLNINYAGDMLGADAYESDSEFSVSEAYTTFRGTAAARMPYWFMTMAMMGKTRSQSKWFQIPSYEIVSSY